jgi:hypothetical protein
MLAEKPFTAVFGFFFFFFGFVGWIVLRRPQTISFCVSFHIFFFRSMMDSMEHLYKIIFFYNLHLDKKFLEKKCLESTEKKCFRESFKQFLPQEMKSYISLLDMPSGEEAEIVYPVMLPKFAIYCVTFNMVAFHERTEEHLQSMREQLEIIVQYCCNRKDDFIEDDNARTKKRPKVLLLGIADDKYRKQTEDNNYEKINEKITRLWKEFSFLSSSILVPAVNNLFFYPISFSKPYLGMHFPSPLFKKAANSSPMHPITNVISSYFEAFEKKYVKLFQLFKPADLTLVLYSDWKIKLLQEGNHTADLDDITNYLESFNLLTWTNSFKSIGDEITGINDSIVILMPFSFFKNLSDCLLKLNKPVKPNNDDQELCQLVNDWNTELDKSQERRRFCDLGVVSKEILNYLLTREIVTKRLNASSAQLLSILKVLGIITICNREFKAPVNLNSANVPVLKLKEVENDANVDNCLFGAICRPRCGSLSNPKNGDVVENGNPECEAEEEKDDGDGNNGNIFFGSVYRPLRGSSSKPKKGVAIENINLEREEEVNVDVEESIGSILFESPLRSSSSKPKKGVAVENVNLEREGEEKDDDEGNNGSVRFESPLRSSSSKAKKGITVENVNLEREGEDKAHSEGNNSSICFGSKTSWWILKKKKNYCAGIAADNTNQSEGTTPRVAVQNNERKSKSFRSKAPLAPGTSQNGKVNKEFYYFLPYLPATRASKFKTMKNIKNVFYIALIPKDSAPLSEAKFSFQDIGKFSLVPKYFMQRLTAKAEWCEKLFKDSVKKQKNVDSMKNNESTDTVLKEEENAGTMTNYVGPDFILKEENGDPITKQGASKFVKKPTPFLDTNEPVSKHNFSIFSPRMGFHRYIGNTNVVWDEKFQLIQVSYGENGCSPLDTMTFLIHMMEDVIYEFHYGIKILPLVSYPSVEEEKLMLFSLKQLRKHFGDHFLSSNPVTVGINTSENNNTVGSKEATPENIPLPRLLRALFFDPTNTGVPSPTKQMKMNDLKKKHHQNYMFEMLKKNFYSYFQFYYETPLSRAIFHVSCPPTLTISQNIQKYFTSNLENTFQDAYLRFCALYPKKEVFTCSKRPGNISDYSWIPSIMFSQHLLLIYQLEDFKDLITANNNEGGKVDLTKNLEIILYEWIIIIVFMKYFYEISHIKSFRVILVLEEKDGKEEKLREKNFFHEFFAPDIKFLHTPFNQNTLKVLKATLKTYFQTMTTDYSLKHHLKDSCLTKLDNYFDSLTIPSLVMEFSHLVSMNYHSFSVMNGGAPYEIDESVMRNFVHFTHVQNNRKHPTNQLQSILTNYLEKLIDLNCFAVERLCPVQKEPHFVICSCPYLTFEGKFEDYLEKCHQLFGWIQIILTIFVLTVLAAILESLYLFCLTLTVSVYYILYLKH